MQAQQIISNIIVQIEQILSDAFGKQVKGYGICIKNANGDIILAENIKEQKLVGIQDNQGTYFYVRKKELIQVRGVAGNEIAGACKGDLVTVPFRIVLVSTSCFDPQKALFVLQKSLSSVVFSGLTLGQKLVKLQEKTHNFVSWEIFQDETSKDATEYKAPLNIVSVDFDLKYISNYNNCTPIKIC